MVLGYPGATVVLDGILVLIRIYCSRTIVVGSPSWSFLDVVGGAVERKLGALAPVVTRHVGVVFLLGRRLGPPNSQGENLSQPWLMQRRRRFTSSPS